MVTILSSAQAKDTGVAAALQVFRSMMDKYQGASTLSFKLDYRYSNETRPGKVLDSLSGNVTISKAKYHYVFDSTETIQNETYNIILFKEDKMMYISGSGNSVGESDPLAIMDSTLWQIHGIDCSVERSKKSKVLTLIFPQGYSYKKMEFDIDSATGLLSKVSYIVKTTMMTGSQNKSAPIDRSIYDEYALVQAKFSNYNTKAVDGTQFDEKNFFTRNGKDFTVTERYKDYKILIGSVNL
jgi:hypothetical protein